MGGGAPQTPRVSKRRNNTLRQGGSRGVYPPYLRQTNDGTVLRVSRPSVTCWPMTMVRGSPWSSHALISLSMVRANE